MEINSICLKCGAAKILPRGVCDDCGYTPQNTSDVLTSIVLSAHVLSETALLQAQKAVQRSQKVNLSDTLKARAQAVLDRQSASRGNSAAVRKQSDVLHPDAAALLKDIEFDINSASIAKNPFALLQVSPGDSHSVIIEKASDLELTLDSQICSEARTSLTQPKKRVEAEIRWFSTNDNDHPIEAFQQYISDVLMLHEHTAASDAISRDSLNTVNALEAVLEASSVLSKTDFGIGVLRRLSEGWGQVIADPEDVLDRINEDYRQNESADVVSNGARSGFPPITDFAHFKEVLRDRQRELVDRMLAALNILEPAGRAQILTELLEEEGASQRFSGPPGALIHGLVDKYELSVHRDLAVREENLNQQMENIRTASTESDSVLADRIDIFANGLMDWDSYAQPVQLSYEIRGLRHESSINLAESVRTMSVDLFNDHGHLHAAENLSFVLAQVFEEVPVVLKQAETDIGALNEIREERENQAKNKLKDEREREEFLNYRCEFGRIFKTSLILTPDTLSIGSGFHVDNCEVTGLRYGGKFDGGKVTHFVTIETANANKTLRITQGYINEAIQSRFWKAFGARLVIELISKGVAQEDTYILGRSFTLSERGLIPCFGSNQLIPWRRIKCNVSNGILRIDRFGGGPTESLYSKSVLEAENSASIWSLLDAVKKRGATVLSELL